MNFSVVSLYGFGFTHEKIPQNKTTFQISVENDYYSKTVGLPKLPLSPDFSPL